jgi:hypothetical protein
MSSQQRHFLTFAAPREALHGNSSAFVVWTVFQRGSSNNAALGLYWAGPLAVFGTVRVAVYDEFLRQPPVNAGTLLRLELTTRAFEESRRIWAKWTKRVETGGLLYLVPYLNSIVFLEEVVHSIKKFDDRIATKPLDWSASSEIAGRFNLPEIPSRYIAELSLLNQHRHCQQVMQ